MRGKKKNTYIRTINHETAYNNIDMSIRKKSGKLNNKVITSRRKDKHIEVEAPWLAQHSKKHIQD